MSSSKPNAPANKATAGGSRKARKITAAQVAIQAPQAVSDLSEQVTANGYKLRGTMAIKNGRVQENILRERAETEETVNSGGTVIQGNNGLQHYSAALHCLPPESG